MPKDYVRLVSFADAGINEVAGVASRFAKSRVARAAGLNLAAIRVTVSLEDQDGKILEDEAYFARIDERFYFPPEVAE